VIDGHAPELTRSLGGFQVFAISFAFISVAVGVFATYDDLLRTAGPVGIWLWVLAALTAAIRDVPAVSTSGSPVAAIIRDQLGPVAERILLTGDHQHGADDEDQHRGGNRGVRAGVDAPHEPVSGKASVTRHREHLSRAGCHHHHSRAEHREGEVFHRDVLDRERAAA
jgi:hypothetical protein